MSNPITNGDAADVLANGHRKSKRVPVHSSFTLMPGSFPGSEGGPGAGAAPGANGPPTTGAIGPGGPLGSV